MNESATVRFAVLDLVQAGLVAAIPWLVPSGSLVIDGVFWTLAALMVVAAPTLVFGGRTGRIVAGVVCVVYWVAGAALVVGIGSSAAYLTGIYGTLGKTLGAAAWLLAALVAVLFWLIPAHELVWLRQQEQGE